MPQVSNTFETYDAVGNREELSDRIWMITPDETPFLSLIGRENVASTRPEWQTDTLDSVDLTNNQPEGNEWVYDAITPTTRVGNYTQISDKKLIISRTQEKTSKAGRRSEIAREVRKKGTALKIDMETISLANQASAAGTGNGASNRTAGGFRAWLASNDQLGSGGASGGFSTATGLVTAATNGTQRAFTKALLDSAILAAHNSGGSPTTLMVSPYVKTVFSDFMDDANIVPLRKQVSSGAPMLVSAADAYMSNFGTLTVVSNRQFARAGASIARNAYLIDPSMVTLGVFDDIMIERPAKTGDANKRVLLAEYCLKVNNEAAHAVVADLFGLTSST